MPPIRTRESQAVANDDPVEDTSLQVLARRLTRMHEMFFCTTALLNLGKETHGMDKQERTQHCQASDKKKRLHLVLEELLRLEPTIVQRLQTAPSNYRRTVNRDTANSLSKGQSNGRSEDMRKMANLMNDERVWSWGPLPGSLRRKELRGLNHEGSRSCAHIPYVEQKVIFSVVKPDRHPIGGPVFVGWVASITLLNRLKGYCTATCWLRQAGKGLLLSLSSVDNITGAPGARGSGTKRKSHKGLAKRYKINMVTTSFIAYVVACVRHALTSDKVFDETSNGFNYPAFYDGIKQYLDAPSFASRAAALIEWWNLKIFGDVYFGPEEPQESQEFGTLAALLAEVEGDCDGNIPGAAEREDADD
ncbi:hypothetical protein OPQ81_011049 [Rhizoctonia solani]|nr:hypothetical protein OPQ81_011049 [Rhizoctonia solani]